MLTKKDQKYFLNFLTQFYYENDKRIIEERFDKVEEKAELKKRDRLLKTASKNAKTKAKKDLRKLKKRNIDDILDDDISGVVKFANDIQKEILDK